MSDWWRKRKNERKRKAYIEQWMSYRAFMYQKLELKEFEKFVKTKQALRKLLQKHDRNKESWKRYVS